MTDETQLIMFKASLNTQYKQKISMNMFRLFEYKII